MLRGVELFLPAIDEYVGRCFAAEDPPRVSELAELLGMSREALSRTFVHAVGIPLTDYMKGQQVAHAMLLLERTRLTTRRIAYRSGFGTRRTFYRAFRRVTGTSPDHYRRSHNVSTRNSIQDE